MSMSLAIALPVIVGDLFGVGNDRVRAAMSPAIRRRDTRLRASAFHFFRFRSRPSTFNATGIPVTVAAST